MSSLASGWPNSPGGCACQCLPGFCTLRPHFGWYHCQFCYLFSHENLVATSNLSKTLYLDFFLAPHILLPWASCGTSLGSNLWQHFDLFPRPCYWCSSCPALSIQTFGFVQMHLHLGYV
ncbi:hypothetical protein B0H19DRAFT_1176034 [Mycena capillaripes]|nr:hypothetical protein B0H19DRAFT_1176034 [Mycena capillaripes]